MKTNKTYITSILFVVLGFFSNAFAQEQTKDSLSHYIKVAIENNPGVKSQRLVHEAFLQKIPQAGAYQDPELSLEAYTMPMEIIGGRSIGNISLMQMFPWFGTRKAARTEATHMANMQDQQYREAVDNLILQVSTQWYTMQKLNEQLHNNEENKKILDQLEQLALRKFSSPPSTARPTPVPTVSSNAPSTPSTSTASSGMGGMSMGKGSTTAPATNPGTNMSSGGDMGGMAGGSGPGMSEVLRIQMEIAEIENNIESLHSQIKAEKAKFNALLNRDATEEVVLGKEIYKVEFLYSEKEALAFIEQNNPMLEMISEEGLAFKAKAEMDRKMSYPMIGIGAEYMVVGKTDNMMLAMEGMNGKDMIMPMVSVTLPLFRKKYNAQQKEGQLWRKSTEENFKNTFNSLKSEYYGYKSQLDDAERVVKLYEKQTILAQTTYNLIVKEFVTGKSDLTNVIQVQRQLLDYQLRKAEALANYNTMVVSIKKLLADNK
ncbi:TolC family protein [Sphingobacterium sp. JB170]|uniref:TolC family protein n=1 Tax=Sphingobacterium sp. JB170 TaxID=1434842 RepID=UPI00097E99EB|nr:TolC family protein [Sphingobacterium sp. JB170]SJN36629.1 Heavy metal RND efflux outer membrane protein, CzcC family [Sphingobacterium sp. JB170]